jgi:hypothetical protein
MLDRRATIGSKEGCRRVLCLLLGRSRRSRWRIQSRMRRHRRFGRVVVGGSDGRLLNQWFVSDVPTSLVMALRCVPVCDEKIAPLVP